MDLLSSFTSLLPPAVGTQDIDAEERNRLAYEARKNEAISRINASRNLIESAYVFLRHDYYNNVEDRERTLYPWWVVLKITILNIFYFN